MVTVRLPSITVQAPVPTVGVFPARAAVAEQTDWSVPAFAVVGDSPLVMVTVSLVVGQVPFVIVQTNEFAPRVNPVTPDVGELGVVTVAPPAITVHAPEPGEGVLPASVAVVEQTVWSGPAFAAMPSVSRLIVTVSLDGGHDAFVIVQTNVFAPLDSPVTPDVGFPGAVTDALPVITVHAPVPTVGVFPARVAVGPHTVWSGPAFAVVGASSRIIVTVSLDGVQTPLLIVQTNVFAPTESPVTPEVRSAGVVTSDVPAKTVHAPVPTVGVLPARVAVVEQTVWSEPAFDAVGD